MLILRFLFERNINDPLPKAVSPVASRNAYVAQRKTVLRKQFTKPGANAANIHQQLDDIEKNKNKSDWEATRF